MRAPTKKSIVKEMFSDWKEHWIKLRRKTIKECSEKAPWLPMSAWRRSHTGSRKGEL